MRISDDTRYPHPVLSDDSGDFDVGAFSVAFQYSEVVATGKVSLQYEIALDNPEILALVKNGTARIGAFIRCQSTYFSSLELMSWPKGQIEFPDGALLDRVYVRPLIWLTRALSDWSPENLNPEFSTPLSLGDADILAVGLEARLTVGRAKLAPLESIFTLKVSEEPEPGSISVQPDGDKITILASKAAFDRITDLRGTPRGKALAIASVYLPAVMELLDQMQDTEFEGRRWRRPFDAKCDALGIDPLNTNLLQDSQKLLNHPLLGVKMNEGVG